MFHTDATRIRAWERFRIVDHGDCQYTIQTANGDCVGIYTDDDERELMTTDRNRVSPNELFQLVMDGLASPPIIH